MLTPYYYPLLEYRQAIQGRSHTPEPVSIKREAEGDGKAAGIMDDQDINRPPRLHVPVRTTDAAHNNAGTDMRTSFVRS